MPEERQTPAYLSGPGSNSSKPKVAAGKYYDIAATLFSTGRSGELVDLFIAAARDGDYNRIENLVERRGDAVVSVDVKDKRTGNTALIWAAKRGHIKIVQLLLKHGADVTLKNYDGKTAVEVASPGIKKLLLDAVGQTTLSIHQRLLQAAWQGDAVRVRQLLAESKVLDIDCQNSDGLTPLLLLCRDLHLFEKLSTQLHREYDPTQVLTVLLDNRANIHALDGDGKSCLHYVSQSKASFAKQLAENLLHHGSQTEQRDRQCLTPIHFASQTGNVDVITTLIDGGSEVNARGFAGATPLHYTAYNDHDRAAATLLDHGADILLTDDQGLTALDVARTKKMKSRLREAWTEVVQGREEVNLAPVKPPTRDGSRLSMRVDTPDLRAETPNIRRGEVLFDGLPLNPFGSNLAQASKKGRTVRPMTAGEKALLAEEHMLSETGTSSNSFLGIRDGVRRLGVRRQGSGMKQSPLPVASRSAEKLPPVRGDLIDTGKQRSKPGTIRYQRSLTEITKTTKHNKLSKLFTYPRSESRRSGPRLSRDSPICVRRLAPDLQEDRLRRLSQTPGRMTPSRQTPSRLSPGRQTPFDRSRHSVSSPCLADLASTCNEYLYLTKRRSFSCGQSDEYDTEEEELRFSPKVSPRDPSPPGTERARVKIPATIEETRSMSVQPRHSLPTLEQMRLTKSVTPVQGESLFPNSRKVLPPTPVQKSLSNLEHLLQVSQDVKDVSPGSSEEFEESLHVTAGGEVIQLERRKPYLKTEFIIEESRPKDLILQSSGSDSCDSVESNPAKSDQGSAPVPPTSPAKSDRRSVPVPPTSPAKCGRGSPTGQAASPGKSPQGPCVTPPNSPVRAVKGTCPAPPPPSTKHNTSVKANLKASVPGNRTGDTTNQKTSKTPSNTDKLRTVAKDNAALADASNVVNTVSNLNLSFSGKGQMTVAGAYNERVDNVKKDIGKNFSPVPVPSQRSPVKVPLKTAVQKPNSASGKSMSVNPTKLISSMKKRAILRSKLTTSDPVAHPKEPIQCSSAKSKSFSKTSQDGHQTAIAVAEKAENKSGTVHAGNDLRPKESASAKSKVSHINTSKSATSMQQIVVETESPVLRKSCPQVHSGSSVPRSPVNLTNQEKSQSGVMTSAEHLGKTPLVKIFSTSSKPRYISAPVEMPLVEQTPLIVNPFEDFVTNVSGANVSDNASSNRASPVKPQRVSSATSRKLASKNGKPGKVAPPKGRQTAANTSSTTPKRVPSGRRRGSRAEQKGAEEKRPGSNTRPKTGKSGKRVRSGKGRGKKADKENLGKDAAKSDVALISGIGWHIATSCQDKSDIQAVRLTLDSDSCEEEEFDLPEAPALTPKPFPFRPLSSPSPSPRFVEVKTQPQQLDLLTMLKKDDIPPMNLDMSRNTIHRSSELSKSEQWEGNTAGIEVRLDQGEASRGLKEEDLVQRFSQAVHTDLLKCALSPIPESPALLSRTTSALHNFSQAVPDHVLSDLLGVLPGDALLSDRSVRGGLADKHLQGAPVLHEQTPRGGDEAVDSDGSDSDDTLVSQWSGAGQFEEARSRKSPESRFVELKRERGEESVDDIVEEILSSTGPASLNSTLRSNRSAGSRNSTLTDADVKILKSLHNTESPFHAKPKRLESAGLRESTDQEAELGANPDLLKVFHAEDFKLGQRMKAMIDAGADQRRVQAMIQIDAEADEAQVKVIDTSREHGPADTLTDMGADQGRGKAMLTSREHGPADTVTDVRVDQGRGTAMLAVDTEAKQLERIIHSFRKMELQANPQERSQSPRVREKSQSPQRGRSSTLENPKHRRQKPPPGRPHSSAGFTSASKARRGRFTEIKDNQQSEKFPTESVPANETDVTSAVTQEKCSSLIDSPPKPPENELNDSTQRSTSACSSSSSQSLPKSEEDTICWKKGNILGRGAFGTVWCGLTGEGELIAVKQIELNTSDMEKAKREYEKIQEEVELLKTLTHRNIVGYLGTSFEDNFVSIYMQFVPGGSIASILARFGALEEKVFCLYTKQILEGVEYLHRNDVIHRDIKGGNIMLMPTGVIKLIDFGCAKRLCINLSMSRSQILKSMKGTPYWMAPEVVNETGHGRKSDIWSIGCTVFEMATRKPPWSDMSPLAAIFAIGCDKPVPQLPEHFSKDVRDFVNKCLTRDQNERLSASDALQHRFITRRRKSRAP